MCICSTRARCCSTATAESMTAHVAGRVFQLRGAGRAARRAAPGARPIPRCGRRRHPGRGHPAGAENRTACTDLQRARQRLKSSPCRSPPRFEDAFVDMPRRGQPKRHAQPPHAPAVERPRVANRSQARPHQPVRRLHRRRPHHFAIPPRRDLRPARPQRRRQVDNVQDAVRAAAADARARRRVDGLDLLQGAASAARARLGYMAQKFSLYGDLSVAQNSISSPASTA